MGADKSGVEFRTMVQCGERRNTKKTSGVETGAHVAVSMCVYVCVLAAFRVLCLHPVGAAVTDSSDQQTFSVSWNQ